MHFSLHKILCPIDFSAPSKKALTYAEAFAEAYDAELHLLHVVEPHYAFGVEEVVGMAQPLPTEVAGEAEKALKQLVADREVSQKVEPVVRTVVGRAFVEIIRVAREEEFDLIVVGSHGRSGLSHLLIGSVAEKVVRKAPCPVLTVKADEHEFVLP